MSNLGFLKFLKFEIYKFTKKLLSKAQRWAPQLLVALNTCDLLQQLWSFYTLCDHN